MVKLSIIIPVYKVEKYIEKCLKSIFTQSVDCYNYEVIIVNDGTPDNSMNVINKYAEAYKNLKILNQLNQGLSIARNNGIKIATGRYVWCVDSDDWIDADSINVILEKLDNDYDMIAIGVNSVFEDSLNQSCIRFSRYSLENEEMSGKDFLFDNNRITPTQKYIYKLQFLRENKLEYFPGIFHEDIEYCMRALYLAKRMTIINKVCYYYLQRTSGAISASYGVKNFRDLSLVFNELSNFEENIDSQYLRYWKAEKSRLILMFMLGAMGKSALYKNNKKEFWIFFESVKPMICTNLWRGLLSKRFNIHNFIMCCLYYLSPQLLFKHISAKSIC